MLHIAILDVDVPVPTVYSARGLYSSQFRHLLQAAASRLNSPASTIYTTAFDVIGGSLPPLRSLRTSARTPTETNGSVTNGDGGSVNPLSVPFDAILITGAAAAAYESAKYPWIIRLQAFLQKVFNEYPHVKMFGSCFGHQIIGQALLTAQAQTSEPPTVTVEACPQGSEMGLASITLNPKFAAHFPNLSSASLPVANQLRLQMIHGDWVSLLPGIKALPEPWTNVGSTELCPVQGLFYPGRVLTYQGHFEFDVFVNTETCLEFGRRSGWDPKDVERYLGLIKKGRVEGMPEDDDDAKVAAEVVMLFFTSS
ncbi:class I glutamine amidotransferase-like protein [Aspergillus pseudoustus]|uniref:Class I glutamine amidotransferase-like protein n=1 Tax=Aspergillus pseudoustus TaxID=1810923 RepID=A0ABR4KUP3_9EURO